MQTKKEQLLELLNKDYEDVNILANDIMTLFDDKKRNRFDVALLNRLYSAQLLIEDSIATYVEQCDKEDYRLYVSPRMK